ncbi:MAG: hypothetical protein V2J02_17635 [Pseudomonadales bacterium]|nr:hypothetical protein [Pseudomonadales bacterium]
MITSFVVHAGRSIVAQGSFQVLTEPGFVTFASSDGASFSFEHSYRDAVCLVDVSSRRQGVVEGSRFLEIPINRPKRQWKRANLGATYDLLYRSGFETTTPRVRRRRGTRTIGPHLLWSPEDA